MESGRVQTWRVENPVEGLEQGFPPSGSMHGIIKPGSQIVSRTACMRAAVPQVPPTGWDRTSERPIHGHKGSMCIKLRMERNSRAIVQRLRAEGFELVKVSGSHHKFRKGSITVIVPHPKKDLPVGTARAIAKSAGWM